MQLVIASASHLLSLVDARASQLDEGGSRPRSTQERTAIEKAESYYREAANGQAQMVYFGGMAAVAGVDRDRRGRLADASTGRASSPR